MNRLLSFSVIVVVISFIFSTPATGFPMVAEKFDFTLVDGSRANLGDYQDKPIVLDWSASWCPLCKENQKIFKSLYNDYKDFANFITISYGGSGDDLSDVQAMKNSGSYPWNFALDTENYAAVADAQNADVWILDTELNLIHTWNYAIVKKTSFADKLSGVIGPVTVTSSGITTVITSPVVEIDDEVNTFGLFENPLFIGFVVLSVGIIIYLRVVKRK